MAALSRQLPGAAGTGRLRPRPLRFPAARLVRPGLAHRGLVCRAAGQDEPKPADKEAEYIEALKKGGVDQKTAKVILDRWKEAGADSDPSQLRKLFLKQSLVPITASLVQLLFDAAAAYSIFMSAGFFALGPDFTGRVVLVFLLDFLAIYFAVGLLFDVVTLASVLITTAKLGASPVAFYGAVKAIASPAGASRDGLAIVEKAKAAVSAVKVAQALDAIAGLLEQSLAGKAGAAGSGAEGGKGAATRSIDTLTNLSAYLTLHRAESQAGFDPAAVGMSEAEAADIALAFARFDLDDNGRLDAREFAAMLQSLGASVSDAEAAAAMEALDANGDGLVSFAEFAAWWSGRKRT